MRPATLGQGAPTPPSTRYSAYGLRLPDQNYHPSSCSQNVLWRQILSLLKMSQQLVIPFPINTGRWPPRPTTSASGRLLNNRSTSSHLPKESAVCGTVPVADICTDVRLSRGYDLPLPYVLCGLAAWPEDGTTEGGTSQRRLFAVLVSRK